MATCPIIKINSNSTALSFAEEECPGKLPAQPVWFGLEPNSYKDFGVDVKTEARAPIDPSRQNKKGTTVDLDSSGGFAIDYTATNLLRLMQGFFFADVREQPSSEPTNAAKINVTAVSAAKVYSAAALQNFAANRLVAASGFTNAANNGLKTVVSSDAAGVTVVEATVAETAPPAASRLDVVGYQFPAGDLAITVVGTLTSLTVAASDFTVAFPKAIPGSWLFIGGDVANTAFANNKGFIRIRTIAAKVITVDDATFVPVAEVSTGKTIQVFTGNILRNEKDPSLIKYRTWQLERQLGKGPTDTQAEYLLGAVADEFSMDCPKSAKLTCDLGFVATSYETRSGEVGDKIKDGIRVLAKGEEAFNTSQNIYMIKIGVYDAAQSLQKPLFAYCDKTSFEIKNGAEGIKAVGFAGSIDTTVGNFEVKCNTDALFTTVEAASAVRRNADVSLSTIFAARNGGFILDVPLLGLSGGQAKVEKNKPITLELKSDGAESKFGHTLLFQNFVYLPKLAMPV